MPRPTRRADVPRARRASTWLTALGVAVLLTVGVVRLAPFGGEPAPVLASDDGPTTATDDGDTRSDLDEAAELSAASVKSFTKQVRQEMRQREREARIEKRKQKAKKAKKERLRQKAEDAAAAKRPYSIRIGSFNVLGSQHTAPGGSRRNFPPASVRTAQAAGLVGKHGVDVLGTQELQDDQLRDLQNRTGMAAYPGFEWGAAETDNSILWDPDVYELVSGDRFTITFMSRARPQPIVRLRDRETGREFYVVNIHPSAGGGQFASQRAAGHQTAVNIVNGLKGEGLPVFLTGDMNDREAFYCRVAPQAALTAPNGGSYGDGCRPPPQPLPVDWVIGSGATWSEYWRDTTPVTQRVSDHFFISATATVD